MTARQFSESCLRGDWRLPPGEAVVATAPRPIAPPLGGVDRTDPAPEIAPVMSRRGVETRRSEVKAMDAREFVRACARRAWRDPI